MMGGTVVGVTAGTDGKGFRTLSAVARLKRNCE